MKKALITGITGQDGAYLAAHLLEQGYRVFGLQTRRGSDTLWRLRYLDVLDRITLIDGDVLDVSSLVRALERSEAGEAYNLAAQSFVATSWDQPLLTAQVTGLGAINMLEAVRMVNPQIRFYQASSSEMFGKVQVEAQNESTPFHPRSPYAVAKVYAFWQTVNYREAYGLFACNGILFNHESPRRGETFVTRKITRAATRIKLGLQDKVYLGNLEAERDWGFAGDYVQAMWLMLQQNEPDDFVIATGERRSVRHFAEAVFGLLDLDWQDYVAIDERYLRPAEVDSLQGDASRAHKILGWRPDVSFDQLVEMMVESDMELAKQERVLVDAGLKKTQWPNGRHE